MGGGRHNDRIPREASCQTRAKQLTVVTAGRLHWLILRGGERTRAPSSTGPSPRVVEAGTGALVASVACRVRVSVAAAWVRG
jgi:hypothetical protein